MLVSRRRASSPSAGARVGSVSLRAARVSGPPTRARASGVLRRDGFVARGRAPVRARLSVDDAAASPGAIEASATRLPHHPSPAVPRPYRGASFAPHASVPCSACGAVAVQRADASCQTDPGDLTPLGRASPDAPGAVPSRDVLHRDDATTRRARGAPPPPQRARADPPHPGHHHHHHHHHHRRLGAASPTHPGPRAPSPRARPARRRQNSLGGDGDAIVFDSPLPAPAREDESESESESESLARRRPARADAARVQAPHPTLVRRLIRPGGRGRGRGRGRIRSRLRSRRRFPIRRAPLPGESESAPRRRAAPLAFAPEGRPRVAAAPPRVPVRRARSHRAAFPRRRVRARLPRRERHAALRRQGETEEGGRADDAAEAPEARRRLRRHRRSPRASRGRRRRRRRRCRTRGGGDRRRRKRLLLLLGAAVSAGRSGPLAGGGERERDGRVAGIVSPVGGVGGHRQGRGARRDGDDPRVRGGSLGARSRVGSRENSAFGAFVRRRPATSEGEERAGGAGGEGGGGVGPPGGDEAAGRGAGARRSVLTMSLARHRGGEEGPRREGTT